MNNAIQRRPREVRAYDNEELVEVGYRQVHVPQRVDAFPKGNHKSSSVPGRTAYVRVLPVVNVFQG